MCVLKCVLPERKNIQLTSKYKKHHPITMHGLNYRRSESQTTFFLGRKKGFFSFSSQGEEDKKKTTVPVICRNSSSVSSASPNSSCSLLLMQMMWWASKYVSERRPWGTASDSLSSDVSTPLLPRPPHPNSYLQELPEASLPHREKDASDTNVVTWLHETRVLALHTDTDGTWQIPHWHLVTL